MTWYKLNCTLRFIVLFWLKEFNKAKTLFVRFFVLLYPKHYKGDPTTVSLWNRSFMVGKP